jgi:hypothetical protein
MILSTKSRKDTKFFLENELFCRHLQGVSFGNHYPGLKPWAKSWCPFGADSLSRLG